VACGHEQCVNGEGQDVLLGLHAVTACDRLWLCIPSDGRPGCFVYCLFCTQSARISEAVCI
jgi:hypothetical protein